MKEILSAKAGMHQAYWILVISICSFGLTISPDSVSINAVQLSTYSVSLTNISLKNQSNTTIIVDSILIHFQNGDSSDFRRGFDCQSAQFFDYVYKGWVYGDGKKSLRYLHDSLFLLQDSAGNITSVSIAPNDSTDFDIYLVVNCPFCGRMPSFPGTTKYLYLFHSSSGRYDSLKVQINDETIEKQNRVQNLQKISGADKEELFDLAGRPVTIKSTLPQGVVIIKNIGEDRKGYQKIRLLSN